VYPESAHTANNAAVAIDAALANSGLPNRLMTAFEVAEFVGAQLAEGQRIDRARRENRRRRTATVSDARNARRNS
jgi:hypothetical protein